jgi:hypothetical protein
MRKIRIAPAVDAQACPRSEEYCMAKYKAWQALKALAKEFVQNSSVYTSATSPLSENGEYLGKETDQAGTVLDKWVRLSRS